MFLIKTGVFCVFVDTSSLENAEELLLDHSKLIKSTPWLCKFKVWNFECRLAEEVERCLSRKKKSLLDQRNDMQSFSTQKIKRNVQILSIKTCFIHLTTRKFLIYTKSKVHWWAQHKKSSSSARLEEEKSLSLKKRFLRWTNKFPLILWHFCSGAVRRMK